MQKILERLNLVQGVDYKQFEQDFQNAFSSFTTDFVFSSVNNIYHVFNGTFIKKAEMYLKPLLKKYPKSIVKFGIIYYFFKELDGGTSARILAPHTIKEVVDFERYTYRNKDGYMFSRYPVRTEDKESGCYSALFILLSAVNKDFEVPFKYFKELGTTHKTFMSQNTGLVYRTFTDTFKTLLNDVCLSDGMITLTDFGMIALLRVAVPKDLYSASVTHTGFDKLYNSYSGIPKCLEFSSCLSGTDNRDRNIVNFVHSAIFPTVNVTSRANIAFVNFLFGNAINILQTRYTQGSVKEARKLMMLTAIIAVERTNELLKNPIGSIVDTIDKVFNMQEICSKFQAVGSYTLKEEDDTNRGRHILYHSLRPNPPSMGLNILGLSRNLNGILPIKWLEQFVAISTTEFVDHEFTDELIEALQSQWDTLECYLDETSFVSKAYTDSMLKQLKYSESFIQKYGKSVSLVPSFMSSLIHLNQREALTRYGMVSIESVPLLLTVESTTILEYTTRLLRLRRRNAVALAANIRQYDADNMGTELGELNNLFKFALHETNYDSGNANLSTGNRVVNGAFFVALELKRRELKDSYLFQELATFSANYVEDTPPTSLPIIANIFSATTIRKLRDDIDVFLNEVVCYMSDMYMALIVARKYFKINTKHPDLATIDYNDINVAASATLSALKYISGSLSTRSILLDSNAKIYFGITDEHELEKTTEVWRVLNRAFLPYFKQLLSLYKEYTLRDPDSLRNILYRNFVEAPASRSLGTMDYSRIGEEFSFADAILVKDSQDSTSGVRTEHVLEHALKLHERNINATENVIRDIEQL